MKYRKMIACLMMSVVMAAATAAHVFAEAAEQEEAEAEPEEETVEEETDEAETEAAEDAVEVVPVVWEPSPEHPIIDTDEARELYASIKAGEYPTMEELMANPVVGQLDAL